MAERGTTCGMVALGLEMENFSCGMFSATGMKTASWIVHIAVNRDPMVDFLTRMQGLDAKVSYR